MSSLARRHAFAVSALCATVVVFGCSQAVATKPAAAVGTAAVGNSDCFSRAYVAADRSYKTHFKDDWYIKMRATVHSDKVTVIEVHVGPYDGSVGGGIAAKYECSEGRLITLEYER